MLIAAFDSVDRDSTNREELLSFRELALKQGCLGDVVKPIVEQFKRVISPEDSYRFIYWNCANKAIRKSNKVCPKDKKKTLSASESDLVVKFHDIFSTHQGPEKISKIYFKSGNSGWIIGQTSMYREFYLFLDGSSMALSKAQEEILRFSTTQFSNIYT